MNAIKIFFLLSICNYQLNAQNVGIGTATPDQKLVVEGDRIKLQNEAGTKFFFTRTDGDEIDITTLGSHLWITAEEDKNIVLNPNQNSSGNVGIGTHSPTEKLHVAGGAKIESLQGTGNRILYSSPTGIVQASKLDVSKLEQNILELQEQVAQQALLIQQLMERLEVKK